PSTSLSLRKEHLHAHAQTAGARRLHANRTAGGDRDPRGPDRAARPRRPEGPRGRRPDGHPQQPPPVRGGDPRLPRRPPPPAPGPWPGRTGTVHYFLLPYIEGGNLYRQSGDSNGVSGNVFAPFLSPLDPSAGSGGRTRNGLGAANCVANHQAFPLFGARLGA